MRVLKFLVDANLGVAIVAAIRQRGHDVVFVGDLERCTVRAGSVFEDDRPMHRSQVLTIQNPFPS